jgi:cytochrome b
MSADDQQMKNERVWDPLVRLFHWSLVAAFATAWWERGEAIIHETAGKIVIGLIIFRAAWGLIGPASARFENFVRGPQATRNYIASVLSGRPAHHIGHNPAGAAMIGLMLLTLVATAASGVLMTTTALWGNGWIEWIHGTSANLMLFLIAGHLLGIVVAAIQHRENLVWSMITGWKWVPFNTDPYLGNVKLTLRSLAGAVMAVALSVAVWNGSTALLNASVWRMHKSLLAELKKAGCETAVVTGPRVEIYPAFQLHYDVVPEIGKASLFKTVSAGEAFQRRPELSFDELTSDCPGLALPVEAKQSEVLPLKQVESAEATAMMSPVDTLNEKLPQTAPAVPQHRIRSATELAARQWHDTRQFPNVSLVIKKNLLPSQKPTAPARQDVGTGAAGSPPNPILKIPVKQKELSGVDVTEVIVTTRNADVRVKKKSTIKKAEKPKKIRQAKFIKARAKAYRTKIKKLKRKRLVRRSAGPDWSNGRGHDNDRRDDDSGGGGDSDDGDDSGGGGNSGRGGGSNSGSGSGGSGGGGDD